MKSKNMLLVVVLLLAAGAVYWFAFHGGSRGGDRGRQPYAAFGQEDWQKLEVAAPEKELVVLVRQDGRWQLAGQPDCQVKEELVTGMIVALQGLELSDLVTDDREKAPLYHVDEEKGTVIRGETTAGPVGLVVGKVAADFLHTYVRRLDGPQVYRINGLFGHLFARQPEDYCQAAEEKQEQPPAAESELETK
ncbi:MAG: DUF4340 domain-containing protein [Deltaproteobacteria bacterium]|nr:DUF4340 domain-containing protein [Candidatus Anaeroferrophillus wilburensis]MBN2888395.1 DUF4340 domain-containing protein [Deltaproteobacteria bacterium]